MLKYIDKNVDPDTPDLATLASIYLGSVCVNVFVCVCVCMHVSVHICMFTYMQTWNDQYTTGALDIPRHFRCLCRRACLNVCVRGVCMHTHIYNHTGRMNKTHLVSLAYTKTRWRYCVIGVCNWSVRTRMHWHVICVRIKKYFMYMRTGKHLSCVRTKKGFMYGRTSIHMIHRVYTWFMRLLYFPAAWGSCVYLWLNIQVACVWGGSYGT